MAIQFISVSTGPGGTYNSGSPLVLSVPAHANGDFMLLHIEQQRIGNMSVPGAWTSQFQTTVVNFTSFVYSRFASSEPSSYTITPTNGNAFIGASISVYRNVRNPGPIDLIAANFGVTGTTVTASVNPFGGTSLTSFNNEVGITYFVHWNFTTVTRGLSSPWNQRFLTNTEIMYDDFTDLVTAGTHPANQSITISGSIDWCAEYITLVPATVVPSANTIYSAIIT